MNNPSVFRTYGDRRPVNKSWSEIHRMICSEGSVIQVNTVRSREERMNGNDRLAAQLKEQCGMFTPGCQCDGKRCVDNIRALSMCGMCDFDHLPEDRMQELLQWVRATPHTMLAYVTNSGCGIRVIFRYMFVTEDGAYDDAQWVFNAAGETHQEFVRRATSAFQQAWRVGNDYYSRLIGYPCDESCKDVVRASFFCFDKDAYYNADSEPFVITLSSPDGNVEPVSPQSPADGGGSPAPKQPSGKTNGSSRYPFDESIITRMLDKYHYLPSGRHHFWLHLGFRLKYYQRSRDEFEAYKQAALRIIEKNGLLLPDDPSLRKPGEIDDCLNYGYDHGAMSNTRWLENYERAKTAYNNDPNNHSGQNVENGDAKEPVETEDIINNSCPLFPTEVYEHLPLQVLQAMAPMYDYHSHTFNVDEPRRHADALLMSVLANYSVMCNHVQLTYGKRIYSPNIFMCTLANAGAGKSITSFGFEIVKATHNYLLDKSAEIYKEWETKRNKMLMCKNSKSASDDGEELEEVSPTPPVPQMLEMAESTSRSQLTGCFEAMSDCGMIINSTEISSVVTTMKAEFGNYGDLLRKASSNEQITQFFKVDARPIKIQSPRLSMNLSGTFDQLPGLIPNLSDGLFSRFMFLLMEPYSKWIPQRPDKKSGNYRDIFSALSKDALAMWKYLGNTHTWVIFTDEQWERHTSYWENQLSSLLCEGGIEQQSIINRHGLDHCRIAAVLSTLRMWNETRGNRPTSQNMFITCTDEDFNTASMIVDTLLPHSLHLSTIYNQINRKDIVAMSYWKWYQFVLDSMPASFTCQQFLIAANELGKSRSQAYRSLKQLINSRLCMRDVNGLYKKTQGVRK